MNTRLEDIENAKKAEAESLSGVGFKNNKSRSLALCSATP